MSMYKLWGNNTPNYFSHTSRHANVAQITFETKAE